MIIQKFNVNSLDLGDPRLILIFFFKNNKETHLFLNKMLYYSFDLRKGYITHQRRLHHSTYARATSELSKGYVTHQQSQRADKNNF